MGLRLIFGSDWLLWVFAIMVVVGVVVSSNLIRCWWVLI